MKQYQFRNSSIRVDRVSDQAVYDGLKRLLKETGVGASKLAIHPVFVNSQFETRFDEPDGDFKTVLSHGASEIYYFRIETPANITITLRRNIGYENQPWEPYDLLEISPTQQAPFEVVRGCWLLRGRSFFPSTEWPCWSISARTNSSMCNNENRHCTDWNPCRANSFGNCKNSR